MNSGKQANKLIARQLLRNTLRTAKASGIPNVLISTERQRGGDFGERLANAFEDVFALGFDQVIAIGNDSPGLTATTLQQAAKTLAEGQAVMGPARDGGVYLIGLSRADWSNAAFREIRWETASVQLDWESYAEQCGQEIHWLRTELDIDNPSDLSLFLRSRSHVSLIKRIYAILASFELSPGADFVILPPTTLLSGIARRGPPIA